MRLPANLSTLPMYLQSWLQFWTGGRVRSGSGCGNNGNGVHQGSQRRIRRERAPAAGWPCPGAAHSTHPSRIPWSCHGARDESAGRSDDSSRGILELAATCKGTSPSPLWSFPNSAVSHRNGRRSARRGQNRRIRAPARDVVSDPRDTRVCGEGQWPRLGMGLAVARPRRSARRPLVARRA